MEKKNLFIILKIFFSFLELFFFQKRFMQQFNMIAFHNAHSEALFWIPMGLLFLAPRDIHGGTWPVVGLHGRAETSAPKDRNSPMAGAAGVH